MSNKQPSQSQSAPQPEDRALMAERLQDPIWRLTSGELYKIVPADGSGLQPFCPRPEQVKVIRAIHEQGKRQILIPKARRLGMSTVLGIVLVDWVLWHKSQQCSLIDKNQTDASRKLAKIMRVALENLPDWLLQTVKFVKSNESELTIDVNDSGESTIWAGLDARGGSNDILWISEWGIIQFDDPKRSERIRSGALPSARHGLTVVETTWKGGKAGDVWELLGPSLSGAVDDWEILFFPWYIDPRNVDAHAVIDAPALEYFKKTADRFDREGIQLSEAQRRWWAKERRNQGMFMKRENPSFIDECWTVPVEGSVYGELVEQARGEGRIGAMPIDGGSLVYTAWDLGAPSNTVVWYFQIVGREIRFIDCDVPRDNTPTAHLKSATIAQRVAFMLSKGYFFAKHFLPHDCDQTERSGKTLRSEVVDAGLPSASIVSVPRTHSVWVGINQAKELFPSLAFRSPQCDDGLNALSAYRIRVAEDGASGGEPIHDWFSHPADALRTMAEAHHAGLFSFKHTTAETRPDWYSPRRAPKGIKAVQVGPRR